jgi:diguanylate cyclase (GGDEF)-like protein
MMLAALNGGTAGYPFGWQWFWPHYSPPHFLMVSLLAGLFITSIVFFTSDILNVRRFWPGLDRFLRIFTIVAMVNGVCTALWYASARIGPIEVLTIVSLAVLIPYVILIVAGIRAWREGDPNAPFVVAGYACQAIGISLYLTNLGMMGSESHSAAFSGLGIVCDGMLLFAALASRLQRMQSEALVQANAIAEQRRLAFTDGLTGVANRRAYDEALVREWERSSRDGTTLSLILVDIDFFKRYNDVYGHIAGDACLQSVAAAAARCAHRPNDLFARYGGEEFAALLPGTDETGVFAVAQAMCDAVRGLHVEHRGSSLGVVSISVGVASTVPQPFVEQTLARPADEALYRAKESGRNRVASTQRMSEGPTVEPRPPVEQPSTGARISPANEFEPGTP